MKHFARYLWIFAFTLGGPSMYQLVLELTDAAPPISAGRREAVIGTACFSIALAAAAGLLHLRAAIRLAYQGPRSNQSAAAMNPRIRFTLYLGLFSTAPLLAQFAFSSVGDLDPNARLGPVWTTVVFVAIGVVFELVVLWLIRVIDRRFPSVTHELR